MNVLRVARVCRDKAAKCAKIAEHHSHLIYLTLGTVELHGIASIACGGCLFFGALVEFLRFRGANI